MACITTFTSGPNNPHLYFPESLTHLHHFTTTKISTPDLPNSNGTPKATTYVHSLYLMQTNNLETQTSSPPNQIAHDLLLFIITHSLQSSSMIAPHHFHLLYSLSLPSAVLIFYFKELTQTLLS